MTDRTYEFWKEKAKKIQFPNLAFIDGKFVSAVSGKTFENINPATGIVNCQVAACDKEDVDKAVKIARQSFNKGVWSEINPAKKKKILLKLADLIEQNRETFALLESLDMGKSVEMAYVSDVPAAYGVLRWYAESIDKIYDEIAPVRKDAFATITREPMGVVAAVVPWNFPLDMAMWKTAPALISGNSFILKPAEQSPSSALKLAELALEAGVPAGVFNVVTGFGETAGKSIGMHPDIDCAAFTGSTEIGKLFLEYSARSNMKKVWVEAGGKSPNIVLEDAHDLDKIAKASVEGFTFNQGEMCSANTRILIHESIKEPLMKKIIERTKKVKVGDPLDPENELGAMVEQSHADKVMGYIEKGKEEASLVYGGKRLTINGVNCFIEPTIFEMPQKNASIVREEIFGPVVVVDTFKTDDEAIQKANDSTYGLVASLWTQNLSKAHKLARRLRAGSVSVNTVDAVSPMTPFGGYKQSGIGRDLSLHAIDKFTELKTTWFQLD